MVLNRRHVPEYRNIRWASDPDADDCLVIHALGVDPDLTGKGVGSCMIREAVRTARKKGVSALRLDVPDTNEPARNLYIRCGFVCRGEERCFYDNTGWRIFQMYELLI